MSHAAVTQVFVFHGHRSRFANAVFSSREVAEAWIRKHELTGLLTGYDLDAPAFEQDRQKKVPPERYTSGDDHWHYIYGLGQGDEGFDAASSRWDAEH